MSTATHAQIESKRRDYDASMIRARGEPRSPVTAAADPFGEYSLTDFIQETEILERLGRSWNMKFCQATMGHVRRPGGLWVAYDAAFVPKAIIHVERFIGKFQPDSEINFWAEHISTGRSVALCYQLPFVVVVEFTDGRYALRFGGEAPEFRTGVGSRLYKATDYEGTINLVTYFSTNLFKKIGGPKENATQITSAE